jgi:thiol-disulfide isomerase/thioredoxin
MPAGEGGTEKTEESISRLPPRPGAGRRGSPRPAGGRSISRPNLVRPTPQRLSARQLAQRRQRNFYMVGGIGAVVVVIVGGIIVLSVTGGNGKHKTHHAKTSTSAAGPTSSAAFPTTGSANGDQQGTFAISSSQLGQVDGVPVRDLVAAAKSDGSLAVPPQKLPTSAPGLFAGTKPEVLYIGAEWCPFCAAERWPLVMALSKFGTFGNLRGTTSSASDVLASSPTFEFYRATYTSKYLSFVAVEEETNKEQPLQPPTAAQGKLMSDYDRSPYVSSQDAGSIPFIYIAGKYLLIGAQYSSAPISHMPFSTAVGYLTSGKDQTSKGAEAAAGYLVGDICALTHGQPGSVCSQVPSSLLGKAKSP